MHFGSLRRRCTDLHITLKWYFKKNFGNNFPNILSTIYLHLDKLGNILQKTITDRYKQQIWCDGLAEKRMSSRKNICHLVMSCLKFITCVIIQSSSTPAVHSLRKLKLDNNLKRNKNVAELKKLIQ